MRIRVSKGNNLYYSAVKMAVKVTRSSRTKGFPHVIARFYFFLLSLELANRCVAIFIIPVNSRKILQRLCGIRK